MRRIILTVALSLLASSAALAGGTFCERAGQANILSTNSTRTCTMRVVTAAEQVALCTASVTPFACCTGNGTGTCEAPDRVVECAPGANPKIVTFNDYYPGNAGAASVCTPTLHGYSPDTSPSGAATFKGAYQVTIGNYNNQCTGSSTPFACCTGTATGTCMGEDIRALDFSASNVQSNISIPTTKFRPFEFSFSGITPKTSAYNAGCTGSGAPWPCCTGSTTGNCPGSCSDGSSSSVDCRREPLKFYLEIGSNATCTASTVPYACCTGNGTGTCGSSTSNIDIVSICHTCTP